MRSPGDVKKKKKKKKPKKKKAEQTDPPRVGLSKLFPSGIYSEGELQPYKDEYAVFRFCSKSFILTHCSQQCLPHYVRRGEVHRNPCYV